MSTIILTPTNLAAAFDTAVLSSDPSHLSELNGIADTIIKNMNVYKLVEQAKKIPWYVIGALHAREANSDFKTHLANGDPLTARTVHVPAGRPVAPPQSGHLPYTWFESACDAFNGEWMPPGMLFDKANILAFCEHYNGWGGYERHGVNSPYLWSYTNHYTMGYYIHDNVFSATAVNKQPGCAAIFLTLKKRGIEMAL